MDITPGANCAICSGAGKGEKFDIKEPGTLLGDVRDNILNINCSVGDNAEDSLFSGSATSSGI
ncbi:MAG: hypothetical protein LBD17_02785 [Endomicrobium sp.]|nr:hypothetical protein [Endomicrobium sp.]